MNQINKQNYIKFKFPCIFAMAEAMSILVEYKFKNPIVHLFTHESHPEKFDDSEQDIQFKVTIYFDSLEDMKRYLEIVKP